MTILALGLVCWLLTLIVVESEVVRPLRDWLDGWADMWRVLVSDPLTWDEGWTEPPLRWRVNETVVRKASYLASCHLCSGTWIGMTLALTAGAHFALTGWVGVVLAGLLVKAIAHAVLVLHKLFEQVTDALHS